MKILITGANGQLGRSFAKLSGEWPDHAFAFADLPEGDVTDAVAMERLMADADAVVNCAAYTDVEGAEAHEAAAMRVNAAGAGIVASAAARRGVPLVHISTDYVFDGTARTPIAESAAPNPLSAYGRTKLAGEEAVRAAGGRAVVVRTSWLYSEFGTNFVRTMLRVGAAGRTVRVVDDQRGCPTCATDLARAVMALLERRVEGFGVYNFCGAGDTTWYGFAREIFAQAAMSVDLVPVSTREYGARAPRPSYSVLDTTLVASLGIATPPWQESLRACLREMAGG
jgi:dTDP-4-dehydrorhamnose reductase